MNAFNEIRVFRETVINDCEVYIEMLNYVIPISIQFMDA